MPSASLLIALGINDLETASLRESVSRAYISGSCLNHNQGIAIGDERKLVELKRVWTTKDLLRRLFELMGEPHGALPISGGNAK